MSEADDIFVLLQRETAARRRIIDAAQIALEVPREYIDGLVTQSEKLLANGHEEHRRVLQVALAFAHFKAELQGDSEPGVSYCREFEDIVRDIAAVYEPYHYSALNRICWFCGCSTDPATYPPLHEKHEDKCPWYRSSLLVGQVDGKAQP